MLVYFPCIEPRGGGRDGVTDSGWSPGQPRGWLVRFALQSLPGVKNEGSAAACPVTTPCLPGPEEQLSGEGDGLGLGSQSTSSSPDVPLMLCFPGFPFHALPRGRGSQLSSRSRSRGSRRAVVCALPGRPRCPRSLLSRISSLGQPVQERKGLTIPFWSPPPLLCFGDLPVSNSSPALRWQMLLGRNFQSPRL